MKTTVRVPELIEILKANRQTHVDAYEEALEGWYDIVLSELGELVTKVKNRDTGPEVDYNSMRPSCHVKDYDRAIRMMELTTDEEIVLDEREAQQYIMDEWAWSRSWAVSNSRFSESVAELSASRGYND